MLPLSPAKDYSLNVFLIRWLLFLLLGSVATVQAQNASGGSATTSPGTGVSLKGLRVSPSLGKPAVPEKRMPMFLDAKQIVGDAEDTVELKGNASVRRQDAVIKANIINYNKKTGIMDAQVNARMIRDGNIITGSAITYNAEDGTASVDQPNFWMENGGAGIGSWADVFNRDQMSLTDVTYSGCPCPNPSWYIQSEKLDIDLAANEGVATNGVLYFKDVPILASPYLTFPVKKERKSGFLVPTFGMTSNTGADYTQPYYFNLAPEYDTTVQLRAMSKHGLQLGDEFRYMGETYSGTLAGTYLNNDYQTGTNRWLYTAQHMQRFGGGFYGGWNVSGVSDNNYFNDFSTIAINQAPTTYLPRQVSLGWGDGFWSAGVQTLTFQTLQDPLNSTRPQYNRVPEFTLNGARFNYKGLDFYTENTATEFQMPLSPYFNNQRWGPDGQRVLSYNAVSLPIVKAGWYVTPKVAFTAAQYQNNWYGLESRYGYGQSANSRSLPIYSIDSGMTFERNTTFFGKSSLQTLEPRLYYLRVPYQDQSQFPVYDTTLADFNFSQAFQENIYAGWDRLSNANQMTAGLTTRWLDADTGFERVALGVAQRFYFEDQYVTLPFEVPRTNVKSDFLFGANAALTDTLNTIGAVQYNPYTSQWDRAQITARWRPQRLAMISTSYRYQINPPPTATYQPQGQNMVSMSFQWPITNKWYTVGRVDYNLMNQLVQSTVDPTQMLLVPNITQAIAGVEYKGDCCWSARLIFQRYVVGVDQTNTGVFFQLELAGLGMLGQNPMGLLGKSIPDYENINPPVPQVSKFQRYE